MEGLLCLLVQNNSKFTSFKTLSPANELQGHLFLKVYGTPLIEHSLLAQEKRVHKLIRSLPLLTLTVGILEFNPHITGILKPKTLKPIIPWKHPDWRFSQNKIKMLMTVLSGKAPMTQSVCKLYQLLSQRRNKTSCRLFFTCVSYYPR